MPIQNSTSGCYSNNVLPPQLNIPVGAKTHLFQLPRTSSASCSLYQSTASISSENGNRSTSRKRSRDGSVTSSQATTYSTTSIWSPTLTEQSSALLTPGMMSPAPLVNTQYVLATGLDTPVAGFTSSVDASDDFMTPPHLASTGGRGWESHTGIDSGSYFPPQSTALAREANGRPRLPSTQPTRGSWGKTVYSVVGAASRLWSFCTMNAFQGFYAGGGQGYQICTSSGFSNGEWRASNKDEERKRVSRLEREMSSIPGCFPEEDFIPDYMSQTHTTTPRPAKKIQRQKGIGDPYAGWIMVDSTPTSRESSLTRTSTRKIPSMVSPGRRPASKAGRRVILPASRPSQTSYAGSPAMRPDRPASTASARSPTTTPQPTSPVSLEVQRHAARLRRQKTEEDANLNRFNQQLKAMIKEGKEALGTKFEVEEVDGMIDEGYAEGEYIDVIEKW